uniref:Uncharacterized protein LOC104237139 isoform X2 n=1 Tax=Nicotiana sylvestris TaxID=4096 RepID=A0A1U7XRK5_NICSY|nr:PREDICTED: uncharacterized protein LOC104237139 isoform X2 [Nicotiana sylvestris]
MFFNDLIQRRLVSLLQPWLRDEVELDVQLGFLHSHAKLENLSFNTSALNELLDDPTRLCFKEVTVQQLSLHASNWSAPAFDFQIHGLNIVLSVGEEEEDGVRWKPKPRDSSIEERKKILAELDSEGSALHNAMKTISEITPGSWTTNLFDWILQHCRLQVHDAHVIVQSTLSNDIWSLSFEMKELGVQCKLIKGCLLTGLVSSIFLPSGENSFDLNVQHVEINLRRRSYFSCILPSTDLLASAKVKYLQFRELNFYADSLNFSLSPEDITILFVLFSLWSKESKRARTGKQLWEIAATKICSLTSTPKFAFHKIASTVCLWLRYIHAYEKMLLLVGYPVDCVIRKSTTAIVQSKAYSRTFKQQWEVISQIEKGLPVEAIVQARRILRGRAASSDQQSKDGGHESRMSRICWKICQSLSLIWIVISSVLHSVKCFFLLKKLLVRNRDICQKLGAINEDSILGSHICLYVKEFSILISPDIEVYPSFSRKLLSDVGLSYPGLVRFCLSIDFFCLRHSEDVSEQYFSFACGSLKVVSSYLTEDKTNKFNNNFKGRRRKNVHNLQPTLWGEPNQLLHSTESGGANPPHGTDGDFVHSPKSLIEQACLNWRKYSSRFGENEIQNMEDPFILCEIKSFLTDQSLKNLTAGYTTCCMVMGTLNLVLDYLVIVSITVICRQISAIPWTTSHMGSTVVEGVSGLVEDPPVADWNSNYKPFSSGIKVMVPRLLPEKHMQIAVHIAGPRINLTLRKEDFHGADLYLKLENDVRLSFDADDIELGVSPSLESDLTSSSGDTAVFDAKPLKDLQQMDIAKSNGEVNSSRGCTSLCAYMKLKGLKVSLDKLWDNQGGQIVVLNPLTIQLLSLRKDLHSLGSIDIAFSVALHCMSTGLTTLVFMDECAVLLKVISSLLCTVVQVFNTTSLGRGQSYEDLLRRESADSESERALKNRITLVASVLTDTTFNVSTTCELRSVNMILYDSRKGYISHDNVADANTIADRKSTVQPVRGYGVNVSLAHSYIRFSFEEEKAEVLIGFSEFESDIFRYPNEIVDTSDQVKPQLIWSLNSLYQASLSHCKISLSLRTLGDNIMQASQRNVVDGSDSSRHVASMSLNHSPSLVNDVNPSFDWLTIRISLGEVYLARCAVKNLLLRGNELKTLEASVSVGGQFQTISCQSQGGSIIVEIASLVTMVECYAFYCNQLEGLWQAVTEHLVIQNDEDTSLLRSSSNQQLEQHKLVNWNQVEAFAMNISQVSLALVDGDKSGEFQKLRLEGNGNLKLELPRKFSFGITNLSILSQLLHISTEQQSLDTRTPFPSSSISDDQSSIIVHDDTLMAPNHLGEANSIMNEASSSSPPELGNQYHADGSSKPCRGGSNSQISLATPQNYILKDLNIILVAEQPLKSSGSIPLQSNDFWVGSGSISGFDMTLSLREIQIIIFAGESLSAIFSIEATKSIEQTHQKNSGESSGCLEEMVPDGTIVSIKDVDQHMYVAVDRAESGYNLVGAIHYSLVGERALFRVKYHYIRRWKSQVQYLSFISLYAKDESGEPLRLNCCRQSDFVDISSSSDSAWAFWRALPYKHDIYDGDVDLETYLPQTKNIFYLVNKKNDCALAFVNGVLEVVSNPGHPFKFKVFHDPSPYVGNVLLDGILEKEFGKIMLHDSCISEGKDISQRGSSFGVTVSVDKVSLTIVHELSDSKEKYPLLQGSISTTEVVIQISNAKVRVMSRLEILLYYFDSQKNMWRELMHPLEIDVFYRYRFQTQGSENIIHWVPGHFYARLKEVENQSGLSLICQFYDNQDVSVAGRHSTTIFLRHLALANRPPEASFFSIQLTERGFLSTSPLHLSLLDTQSFAWRPRIVSLQESKTFPGPFLVAEVSPRTEDCLTIVVSPLLKIHNDTDFSMELRFQRPQHKEVDYASVMLKAGDTVDDSMAAFGAINLSGERKKTLNSLSVGNFLFSFRPEVTDDLTNFENPSACWSDDLRGGKPVRLSGIFDKLTYQVRKAFSFQSMKYSLSTAHCDIKSKDGRVAKIHFLIESTGKDVPIVHPDNFGYARVDKSSPVALQEQKEIFLLPTVHFSNFLDMEIHVRLSDTGLPSTNGVDCICNEATIPSASSVNLYTNPAAIYFIVTLTSFGTSCKPINSSDSAKRLQKRKTKVQFLDIELDFGTGKYFALLRLSRGQRGILEAAVFTSYTLENNTEFSLFYFPANHKLVSRHEVENIASAVPPELGSYLPPGSTKSWFSKCHKVHITLLDERASKAPLDLDALSGLTEVNLEVEGKSGSKTVTKLGVSLKPSVSKVVPLQVVSMYPRYVILNESDEVITVRQCFLEEDGTDTTVTLNSKQRAALTLRSGNGMATIKRRTLFENFLKKHSKSQNDSSFFVQFQPNKASFSWSGPVCIASLGRFFLKFKKSTEYSVQQPDPATQHNSSMCEFATVHVVEDGPTIVLRFCWPANMDLPYRIENRLENTSITYYQKEGLTEPEVLASGSSVGYVWDDLTHAHKLVVQIDAVHLLREINLDKVREWKPFYRIKQQRGLGFHLPLEKKTEDSKKNRYGQLTGMEIIKLGYEVYAEGLTRVLRICEFSDRRRGDTSFHSCTKMQLRISYFAIQLLERAKQDLVDKDKGNALIYNPIITARLNRIDFDAMFAERHKFNHLRVQSLSVEPKWVGAPFASMLRRHQIENCDSNERVLRVGLVLASSSSSVKQVKHLSIVLQPLDFNLDEETLMRIVPFWRTSLSDTNTPSQKYYIDHFEIHPVKVVASFLPGESYASYSSTQETLRSLLHSVIKIPTIKNMIVELNGILVTHALVTFRELSIKCAQHYSWYAMRAIYIAKGSPLLPPAFASIFDDLASSSLDVFFDPSSGLLNLPGLTIGTFKLISKCIDGKGFSGTKRYFGDLGKTLKSAGSNILFAAVTEISDSVLKGAEASGLNGMVYGFHQGILKLAMEPTLLGSAFMEGGPDRKIRLDRSPGVDELYIEGYLQAMLDTLYKQEYLTVRVIDNQVILKNLPPSSSLIEEIVERVKGFLMSKALLKGDPSITSRSLRHIRGEREWKLVPTVLTLFEHLFVSFAIRVLRKQASKVVGKVNWKQKVEADDQKAIVPTSGGGYQKLSFVWKWGIGKFVLSGMLAYVDGRLCRYIPNPIARRIVSGFLLSFLERNDE